MKKKKQKNDEAKAKLEKEKKLVETEKAKKVEEEKLMAKKKKLFNSIINAKWGMKGIPCDTNGGSYFKFINGKGEMMWAGGKIQDGSGLSIIQAKITQTSDTEFIIDQVFYPTRQNKLIYGAIGGNRRTGGTIRTYTIINEDLLELNSKIEMLDMDALLAGKTGDAIGYTYKNENSIRVRCK